MLVQWVLSMALSGVITLGAMEGFLLLSQVYQAQVGLSLEQAQIRFLVGYFRGLFGASVRPDQLCGNLMNHDNAIMPLNTQSREILALQICRQEGGHSVIVPMRFFLGRSEAKQGITVFVQDGTHRLEALSSGLSSFSVRYCVCTEGCTECRSPENIQDWASVSAVEFYLRFNANERVDKIVTLHNQNRWQFTLKIGSNP